MSRVYNFSAGPAMLPEEVLRQSSAEMLDYQGCGMSVMEMSHRSSSFQNILDQAQQDLKDLLALPDNYKVLFLQGGASQQFAMVPMNLMKNGVVDYIVTGQWAKKAFTEGGKYGKANKLATDAKSAEKARLAAEAKIKEERAAAIAEKKAAAEAAAREAAEAAAAETAAEEAAPEAPAAE